MKEAYYFSHDYNARNDEKILELRAEFKLDGYAAYFMMLESMAENEDSSLSKSSMAGLSLGYGLAMATLIAIVEKCIQLGLFIEEEGRFYSQRMRDHKEVRKRLSEAGKRGSESRWNSEKNGQAIATPIARKGKERKGKETISTNVEATPDIQESHPILVEEETKELESSPGLTQFGNSDINTVLASIQTFTGLPAVSGKMTRIHISNWLKSLKKSYPDQEPAILASKVIELAVNLQDGWHSTKCNDPKHLYYNWQEIVQKGKQPKKVLNPIADFSQE